MIYAQRTIIIQAILASQKMDGCVRDGTPKNHILTFSTQQPTTTMRIIISTLMAPLRRPRTTVELLAMISPGVTQRIRK